MYLQRIEIYNFRGIRHLEVDFRQDSTVLIGENSWGKSSLLMALWKVLGQGETLCQFEKQDLYVPLELSNISISNPFIELESIDDTLDSDEHQILIEDLNDSSGGTLLNQVSGGGTAVRPVLDFSPKTLQTFLTEYRDTHDFANDQDNYFESNYNFLSKDVFDLGDETIAIDLDFKESTYGSVAHSTRLQRLEDAWQRDHDDLHIIHWQIRAKEHGSNFITEHYLVDNQGETLTCDHERLIKLLIEMNPVLRLRDSRMLTLEPGVDGIHDGVEQDFINLSKDFMQRMEDNDTKASDVLSAVETINSLFSKYLADYSTPRLFRNRESHTRTVKDMVNQPLSVDNLESLKRSIIAPGVSKTKIILSILAGAMLFSKGDRIIDKKSRPILIFEDIEARFHPTLLLSFLSIVEAIPVQKIITTNSGDILSAVPLQSLRRLCRQQYNTRCYKIRENTMSMDDQRRIAFHIRLNRPMSLFARCWVLVEGETEVWMLSEIARVLGMSLQSQGIRLVEFAQCGLSPLLKFARAMGISFYVLTDGDEAGVKYANTVRDFVGDRHAKKHLTMLSHLDIEHFFYYNGYDRVFMREANLKPPLKKGVGPDRVIELAIKRKTKPGLALSVLEAIQKQGPEGVPSSIRQMFKRIRLLSKMEFSID